MTAADIHVGKIFHFGWRKTPNVVTSVTPLTGNNQYIARVLMRGPRGAEYTAYVRPDGTCRKA